MGRLRKKYLDIVYCIQEDLSGCDIILLEVLQPPGNQSGRCAASKIVAFLMPYHLFLRTTYAEGNSSTGRIGPG